MLKFINLQKLTAKTLIGILMVGGLVIPAGTQSAIASSCDNNGHGNNGDIEISLSSGLEVLLEQFDPSNPGNGNKIERVIRSSNPGISDANLQLAKTLVMSGNYDYENKPKSGKDSDCDGINDELEVGNDFDNPIDTDRDGTPNFMDTDSDNDGILDDVDDTLDPYGVQGLELHYFESAYNCGYGDIDIDVKVYKDNQLLQTMSKGDRFTISEVDSVDELSFQYQSSQCNFNANIHEVLGGEDTVPDLPGAFNQASIQDMLDNLDSDYKELFLVELGTTNPSSRYYDLQDVVLVVDNNPESLVGDQDINDEDDGNDDNDDNEGNDEDSDADNNGILDKDEFARDGGSETADFDNDGIPNYQDLDDDNDKIPDVMELYSPSELNYADTVAMTYTLKKGKNQGQTFTVKLPNPPKDSDGNTINILDKDAVDTDGTQKPNYQDVDSDGDTIKDKHEAGDNKLKTAPFDENNDGVPNYIDLDSDGDTISDKDEAGDNKIGTAPFNTDESLTGGDSIPDYLDDDSDADTISDADEAGDSDLATAPVDSSLDNDTIPNYLDEDSDGDTISDKDEAGDSDLATDPVNTDKNLTGSDADSNPDYLDLDSDGDSLSDSVEAGDSDLSTSPYNSDNINDIGHANSTNPSGFPAYDDQTPDFRDLDSDDNGILDEDEFAGSFDDDTEDNYRDLDDDNDGIADVIEIGANPSNPTESKDGTDDYQDDNSEDDAWTDSVEGVTTASGTGITTITITSPEGTNGTVNLKNISGGSVKGGTNNTITITEGTNGTVTITGTPEGFDYQVSTYAD